jgi:ABC-2 type transport system permease protein
MTTLRHAQRVDFPGTLRSEWIKFRGLTSNTVLAGFTLLLVIANGIAMPWAYVYRDRGSVRSDYAAYPEMIVDKVGYLGVLLAILAALLIANEYRSGQIRTTLLSVPKRTPALAAKAAIIAGVSLLIGIIGSGIGLALAPSILAVGGYSYDLGVADAFRLIVGSGLYLATLSILGVALGALIRNVVASVMSVIVLLVLVPFIPQIFSDAGTDVRRFFPIDAGSLLIAQAGMEGPLGHWTGYLVLLGWAAILFLAAAIVLKRRDA